MARTKKVDKPAEVLAKNHPQARHPLAKPYHLMCGKHHEPYFAEGARKPKYRRYTVGDVVWSPRQLDKVFSNRFVELTVAQADALEDHKDYEPVPGAKEKRTIVPRGNERYDVIDNETGTTLNEAYLSYDDAKRWEETGLEPVDSHVEASAKA